MRSRTRRHGDGTRYADPPGRRRWAGAGRALVLAASVVVGSTALVAAVPAGSASAAPAPVSKASTSTRGVTAKAINVVFPVVSLNSLAGQEGFAQDAEYGEQTKAINFYVKQINQSGGINGRKIHPIITTFDPTNESAMRALCKTWTEGSPAGLRRAGRHRGLDGRQPAVHHPGGPDPVHRAVDDGHQLDERGLALPVVDRAGPGGHPPGRGQLGAECRSPGRQRRWA